jgi:predicted kinase
MILLVSGIPASGKSTYCRWLEQDQGFIHFDIDIQMFQGTGVGAQWTNIFQPGGSVEPFVSTLRQWLRSVVIDWGFAPARLGVVRNLKEEGVEIWWFDADRAAAQRKYVERGDRALERFEAQIARIETTWSQIAEVFGTHIIVTLNSNAIYMPSEAIFRQMSKNRSSE